MTAPWFFLSYAHLDFDPYLTRFYKDLNATVRRLKGLTEPDVGFMDRSGIETGERWSQTLVDALQGSRVLVVLYSPTYFVKEYCGKEWQVFQWRLDTYEKEKGGKIPSSIIPVLWVPKDRLTSVIPESVTEVQYSHELFGDTYAEEGLRQIMALKKHRDAYNQFVHNLAMRLIKVAEEFQLPATENLPPLHEVPSMFHQKKETVDHEPRESRHENVGPRWAQFVFVAARRDELTGVRNALDSYGEDGGPDWLPYLPDVQKDIALLAMDVAGEMGLRFENIPLDNQLIMHLRTAAQQNKLVVIIADAWTLRLPGYRSAMRAYDDQSFFNCIVVIGWNPKDPETIDKKQELDDAVRLSFFNRIANQDPNSLLDSVTSCDQFKRELSAALNRVRMRVIDKAALVKRAKSGELIAKPVVAGPGRSIG